jgi:hypothetical protein
MRTWLRTALARNSDLQSHAAMFGTIMVLFAD